MLLEFCKHCYTNEAVVTLEELKINVQITTLIRYT